MGVMGRTGGRRRTAIAALCAAVLGGGLLLAGPAMAASDLQDERDALEQQSEQNKRDTEETQAALEDTQADIAQAYEELKAIQARLPEAQQLLDAATAAYDAAMREVQAVADRLEVAEQQEADTLAQIEADALALDQVREAIGQLARQAYKNGASNTLGVVLGAQTSEEFIEQYAAMTSATRSQSRTMADLEQLGGVNRNRQARLEAVREQIEELKAEADAAAVVAEQARQEAADRKAEIDQLIADQEEKAAYLEQQRAAYEAKLEQYEREQAQIAADLQEVIRQQAILNRGNNGPLGAGVLSNPTPLRPPVITSSYGYRTHPIYGIQRLHAGTDFRAYCGTQILAASSGTVVWAKRYGGFGNQVMINHGFYNGSSLMTSYSHLSSFAVSEGQQVTVGQVVGYSGTTGTSTACHLHFEVYVDGSVVNPVTLL